MARRLGTTDEQLAEIAMGRYDSLEPSWGAALRFADAITPQGCVVPDEVYAEFAAHWSPEQIVEITAAAALFAYFNRFAIALEIPVTR